MVKSTSYMHPSYRVSTLQAGGGGVFSWNTLVPLIKVEQRLNATGYLNTLPNQVHPFMAAVYPSVNSFFSLQNNATRLGLSRNGSTNMTVNSADLNPIEHLWDEMEQAIRIRDPLPANLTQLWEALESTWASIPVEHF